MPDKYYFVLIALRISDLSTFAQKGTHCGKIRKFGHIKKPEQLLGWYLTCATYFAPPMIYTALMHITTQDNLNVVLPNLESAGRASKMLDGLKAYLATLARVRAVTKDCQAEERTTSAPTG